MALDTLGAIDHLLKDVMKKRALPGIFVVESSGKIAFASEEAQHFLDEAVSKIEHSGQNGHSRQKNLPEQVIEFARESCHHLQANEDIGQAPARRVMLFQSPAGHHFMIMALALTRSGSSSRRKLLLLIVQRISQRNNIDRERLGRLYGFTKREQEVVTRLVHGNSNKEIAASLNIQEYTVKDHLKHIMAKCQADSRVSVISKVLDLSVFPVPV